MYDSSHFPFSKKALKIVVFLINNKQEFQQRSKKIWQTFPCYQNANDTFSVQNQEKLGVIATQAFDANLLVDA